MAEYLIIRHAEPELRGVLLGQCDPPLSEFGRIAAQALGESVEVSSVVCSPLRRALETAEYLGREVIVIEEFREWSYGAWDGLRWEEIEARFPEDSRRRAEDWFGYFAPGQETWGDFVQRVEMGWARLQALPKPIAIVGHEAVNSVLWAKLRGGEPTRFRQAYCEILEA